MTTFLEKTLTCPACLSDVRAFEITSTNRVGQDTDFCPRTAGFNAVSLVVSACGRCGYAGYASDFEGRNLSKEQRDAFKNARIRDSLKPLGARLDDLRPDHAYLLAAETARHFGASHELVAELMLRASWCLRLEGAPMDGHAASLYRTGAILNFLGALDSEKAGKDDRRAWIYLVAELSRREGDFAAASKYFDEFLRDPPPQQWWETAARALKQRADSNDRSNIGFEDAVPEAEQ